MSVCILLDRTWLAVTSCLARDQLKKDCNIYIGAVHDPWEGNSHKGATEHVFFALSYTAATYSDWLQCSIRADLTKKKKIAKGNAC